MSAATFGRERKGSETAALGRRGDEAWVLATGNMGKLREMAALLSDWPIRLLLPSELGVVFAPQETGETFLENALQKARLACQSTKKPSLADDSGLMVDALNGAPGVFSARYGGEGLTDAERCALLLRDLTQQEEQHGASGRTGLPDAKGAPGMDPRLALAPEPGRSARFVCVLALVFPDGREVTARGVCEGYIARAMHGLDGFGYDPIFYLPSFGKTMAQMTSADKNACSHRARAVRALRNVLP